MIKAGIIGATGYAGAELVRLLLGESCHYWNSHPWQDSGICSLLNCDFFNFNFNGIILLLWPVVSSLPLPIRQRRGLWCLSQNFPACLRWRSCRLPLWNGRLTIPQAIQNPKGRYPSIICMAFTLDTLPKTAAKTTLTIKSFFWPFVINIPLSILLNITLLAMSGAFIFVISSLKIPSVTGSCSHMTGTGLGAILFGPGAVSILGDLLS